MLEFTPVDAFMEGAEQAERYNYYKRNNPNEDCHSGSGLQRQAIDLCKNNNRSHLYSTANPWNLDDASEGDESQEYYYICKFKVRGYGNE